METGEDIQGLRKVIDLTRLISVTILCFHFYFICYKVFHDFGLTAAVTDKLLGNIAKTGLFVGSVRSKVAALLFLVISVFGKSGKKDENVKMKHIGGYIICGLFLYWLSVLIFFLPVNTIMISGIYISVTVIGYVMILMGGAWLTRVLKLQSNKDIFNSENESFPQEERLLQNEYSVNIPTKYKFKGQIRDGWFNCINPFRSILVSGSAGAGKTYFVIRHIIDQHLQKGFSMLLYDFKFDDLSKMAYNKLLKYAKNYDVKPKFYVIDLENPKHRCNPLDPDSMLDITDATESSRTIMLGLNKQWLQKSGDFFVESPINFLTAVIWFLRKYQNGKYCTLPHVIELMMIDYDPLFTLLQQEEEVKALINPFISAYRNNASAQLEGQIASAKIGLARLSSPQLYYVLSGNDFTLDINNPEEPKIVCIGNNPQKIETYGAVLSLYVSRLLKMVNKKGKLKSSLVFDEFPTIVATGIVSTISTARSNLVSVTLGIQSIEQVKKEYGAEFAEIIAGISGNIISGQVTGDSAKRLSESFGKIMQDRESLNINSSDTSVTRSTQMDSAIPASKIATLSSGEFVGVVSDSPDERIKLKMFHAEFQNDHNAIALEDANYVPLPEIRKVSFEDLQENYLKIKNDIQQLILNQLGEQKPDKPLSTKNVESKSKKTRGRPTSKKPVKSIKETKAISL
ncbi:YWFCY domain-containing protein [Pedobacter sp. MC2016-15]|uniref:conjugal transfer protein MobC n=1 Tax=Pedobacter sp. MC2016-15 TaxID=2994473 RepID=UPI00224759A5|nr:conjugal transfer protein MobC [Pedobacter sp. MC2016-15]MCX2479337.1 YWFCY domain-containing protein [Pedobacter sp. MC2016-15]